MKIHKSKNKVNANARMHTVKLVLRGADIHFLEKEQYQRGGMLSRFLVSTKKKTEFFV